MGGDINYLMSDNSVDTRFAGILRYFRINYDCYYNKKTTPLEALFFDYYALLAFHYCAKDGRVVLNIDGTGSQVGWGVVLGPNVCVQRWEMTMRALFLAANEWAKDVVKKNVKTYSLWQYHATKTDTEGLTEVMKSFFGGQTDLGLPFHKPLGFLTDCAPQIIAAIMRALAFDDSDEIITKVMYCNVMTVLIAHCETRQWEKEFTKKVLDFALTILPTLCKWCRAHVIRAIDRWISRTQSPAIVANRKSFHIMAITLARHMTSSLSFIHSIINFGFVMYISQCTFLRVKKTDAITYRPNVSTEKMNEITSLVKAFFHRQYSALSRKLSQCYKDLTDITCVDRKNYMTESLIQSVIDAAVSEKLQFSVSYCVDNDGDTGKLLSNILFGCYGKLKDEEDDERWEVISSVPEARFLYNQVSSTEFSEINGSSSETVLVLNPLFDPSLSGYMMTQWGRNFALFHTGVNDMCLCGRDAVLENSNQGIEGVFGDTKHDPDLLIASKDPATFLHYLAKRQRESSGKLVNQLRRLDQIVEFKNRKIKTEESYGNAEDERENKVDVGWAKKIDRREEILKELNDYYYLNRRVAVMRLRSTIMFLLMESNWVWIRSSWIDVPFTNGSTSTARTSAFSAIIKLGVCSPK